METIAIIHICSDSVKMIQIKLNKNNAYNLVEEYTEAIKMTEHLDSNGNILSNNISSLINILKNYKTICDSKKISRIITIAGDALRSATNCDIIVDLIQKRIDLDIQVINREKEAYYNYLSVSAFTGYENALIMGLVGNQLQLIRMKNRKQEAYFSVSVEALDPKNFDPSLSEEQIRLEVASILSTIPWLEDVQDLPVVSIGEFMEQMAKISIIESSYPLDILHGYTTSLEQIDDMYQKSGSSSPSQLKHWEGFFEHNRNSFRSQLFFVSELMKALNKGSLCLCSKDVKYGVFYDYLLESKILIIRSPLMHSIENILKIMELDALHAFQIRWLSMEIFMNLKPYLDMDDVSDIDLNNIVNTSALLHDSGIIINYYNHHHHSFWVILNAPICGLSHKELLMSAYTASFHRKNNSYVDFEKYSSLLTKKDISIIEKLGVILKLSESLDKRMDNVVKNIDFTITDTEVIMDLSASTYPDMELRDAELLLSDFKRVIGKDLILK